MPGEADRIGRWAGGADFGMALVRVAVSTILLWGALTKLANGERIEALAAVWAAAGVPYAYLLVAISIGLQLAQAFLLLIGLFARMAALLVAVNFTAGAVVSGIFAGADWWPFALLIVLLLHYGLAGGGRFSIDALRRYRLAAALQRQGSLEDVLAAMGIRAVPEASNNPGTGDG